MLRAAIIDSSKEKREIIQAAVRSLNMEIQTADFPSGYDFKEKLDDDATSFDMVLLNTSILKEGDGVKLASDVRKKNRKAMFCFITDSQRYYAEAFKVLATGYLLYPFDPTNLHNVITFFYQQAEPERRASWMIKELGGNYKRIYCRNIVYIESSNREIIIHMEDGSEICCYSKLDTALEALPKELFLRCHQSYAVSMYFIEEMEHDTFHVPGAEIPISRKYQKLVREAYYDYQFSKM